MSDLSSLRVADAEREQLIEELREHAGEGRLSAEELEERIGLAYAATTRADADALRADLPVASTSVKMALTKRKAHLRRRLAHEAGGAAGLSLASVGVWLATGAAGEFWPAWVIAITMLPVARDSWGLLGPASDLERVYARQQRRHERHLVRAERRRRYSRHYRHRHRHRYRGLP